MPFSSNQIPLSRSLRDKVLRDFSPADPHSEADTLTHEELTSFLGRSKDTDGSPLTTIKRRAARQHRDPHLSPEDHATLVWICDAFADWEEGFPLEGPLRDHAHRLLPLAVAVALHDENFFTPGEHPLHQLFDELQRGAVGWQVRLDRAGQMLEQRVERAVEKALEWFNNKRIDMAAISRELIAANERDTARAQRMVQRLSETEGARLKTLAARREAAEEINAGLASYALPAAIGEFLKGPWFDSAQLALVKHGSDSQAWAQMKKTALQLMESVQKPSSDATAQQGRQEQILSVMPKELRRWLLSIEHDSEATDSAIGLVEYVHLRLQHGQRPQLVNVAPIELDDDIPSLPTIGAETFDNGGWYLFEEPQGELRAQLVLQLEGSQHLLFANCVGLKALDLPCTTFTQRLRDGLAKPLPNQYSFSLSLASAAGLDTDEKLDQFLGRRSASTGTTSQPKPRPASAPATDTEEALGDDGLPEFELPAAFERTAPKPATPTRKTEPKAIVAPRRPAGVPQSAPRPLESAGRVERMAERMDTQEPPAEAPDAEDSLELILELDEDSASDNPAQTDLSLSAAPPNAPPASDSDQGAQEPAKPAPPTADEAKPLVDVPMGAWLGFHDGETPIMAKLAVYDPRRGYYIFVNRKGISMREISDQELVSLMDQGLVDILETRCYFRDEVERAREKKR